MWAPCPRVPNGAFVSFSGPIRCSRIPIHPLRWSRFLTLSGCRFGRLEIAEVRASAWGYNPPTANVNCLRHSHSGACRGLPHGCPPAYAGDPQRPQRGLRAFVSLIRDPTRTHSCTGLQSQRFTWRISVDVCALYNNRLTPLSQSMSTARPCTYVLAIFRQRHRKGRLNPRISAFPTALRSSAC